MADEMPAEMRAEIDEHLLWVGKCINQWAMLEDCLFDMFATVTKMRGDFAAIVFYRNHSFRSKIELMTEIMMAVAGKESDLFIDWKKLAGRLTKAAEFRNLAAHLPLRRERAIIIGPEGILKNEDSGRRGAKSKAQLLRPDTRQVTVDIAGLRASVDRAIALHRDIAQISHRLKGQDQRPH